MYIAKRGPIYGASLKIKNAKRISWNDLCALCLLPNHLQPNQKRFDFSSSSLDKMGETVLQNSAESQNVRGIPRKGLKMKKSDIAIKVLDILQREYPDAQVTLNFKDPLQLLIATILAAQCTDERVNQVTKELFKKNRKAADYVSIDLPTLEEEIRSTGFYRNKAKSIIDCCDRIAKKFKGQVPRTLEELTSLPGVGRKTANIILGNAFGQQAIAVDTHVKRVTHRLGWATSSDPDKIELELMPILPQDRWTIACHQLVFHGRKICTAKAPQCPRCPVKNLCPKIGVLDKGR
jgi:endonuclease-3